MDTVTLTPETATTASCALAERSARGYCPDDIDQHEAELRELGEVPTLIAETAVAPADPPPAMLAHTGADPLALLPVTLALVVAGIWLVRFAARS